MLTLTDERQQTERKGNTRNQSLNDSRSILKKSWQRLDWKRQLLRMLIPGCQNLDGKQLSGEGYCLPACLGQ